MCRVERHLVTLTEKEFEDILHRNKSVSSGAIMRAVQDASEGVPISAFPPLGLYLNFIIIKTIHSLKWVASKMDDSLIWQPAIYIYR